MRRTALGLVLAVAAAGCGGDDRTAAAPHPPRPAPGCRTLVASLGRLDEPTSMRVQRRELVRLARVADELQRRYSVRARVAAEEYGASLRAEHESISARGDGRITASRRLHAQAEARYRRGRVSARAVASHCPAS